jgi:hypothetical protein
VLGFSFDIQTGGNLIVDFRVRVYRVLEKRGREGVKT